MVSNFTIFFAIIVATTPGKQYFFKIENLPNNVFPACSLKCYICNSKENNGCGTYLENHLQQPQECKFGEDLCYYKATIAGYSHKSINRVIICCVLQIGTRNRNSYRGCARSSYGNPCEGISGKLHAGTCYSCKKDGCNSSVGLRSNLNVIALVFLVLLCAAFT